MTKLSRRSFLWSTLASSSTLLASNKALAASSSNSSAPEKWDLETDVVVLGCGAAGMMAACQAVDGGAQVLVFDKGLSPYHTSTRLNGGNFSACNTRMQKENNVQDSPEEFADNLFEFGDHLSYKEPLLTFTKNSGAAFDWIFDHGLPPSFWEPYAGHTRARTVRLKSYSGIGFVDALVEQMKQRNIKIHHDHELQQIFYDKNTNTVLGIACGNSKKTVTVKARKGVIMATGGLTGSTKSVDRWNPELTQSVPIGGSSNDGSAMMIAVRDVGAPLTHMQYFAEYPHAISTGRRRGPTIRFWWLVPNGALLLNKNGHRFVKETTGTTLVTPPMKKGPDGQLYIFMTQATFEKTASEHPFGALVNSPQWDRARWEQEVAKQENIVTGDTLEEVAQKIGMDVQGLKNQVAEWNSFVNQGKDPQFGRTDLKHKIEQGPYMIVRTTIWLCCSLGGLRVDKHFQVLNWDFEPIHNLYAAGETIGGILGSHYLGGCGCAFAHTSGYVTGRLLSDQCVSI